MHSEVLSDLIQKLSSCQRLEVTLKMRVYKNNFEMVIFMRVESGLIPSGYNTNYR
jgi:hypothetical protein